MARRNLLLVLVLLLGACAPIPRSGGPVSSSSFVVPTVAPADQQADDRRMDDEVSRCRAAALRAPPIQPEDAPFLAQPVVMEGPFKGCVVDIAQARPVTRVIDSSEISPWVPPTSLAGGDQLILANFQHADSFWFAVIELASVREVLVQMEHTGQLNHGQVRVTFDPGETVRLYPQGPSDGRRPTAVDDITFTADGIAPVGVNRPANILPPRQYPLLYRAMSTQQKVQIMTDADGRLHAVEQFRILSGVDPAQLEMADAFIMSWSEHGSRAQFGTMFQLIPLPPYGSLNCTSALFQILDATVTYPNPGWRAQILDEFLPLGIPTYLAWRGYDVHQIQEPDLNVQLGLQGPPEPSS
jgi:hypothetical protein